MLPLPQKIETEAGLEITLRTEQIGEDPSGLLLQISAHLLDEKEVGAIFLTLVVPNDYFNHSQAGSFKIAVIPEFRNQGIGTELYRAVKNLIGPEGVFLGGSDTIWTYFCKHKLALPFDVSHYQLRQRGITNHTDFANHVSFNSFDELRQFCRSIAPDAANS